MQAKLLNENSIQITCIANTKKGSERGWILIQFIITFGNYVYNNESPIICLIIGDEN